MAAKGHGGCKVCNSPSLDFVDQAITSGTPYRVIVEELADRRESITIQNISTHKLSHWQPATPELDAALEDLRSQLRAEMRAAPPTLAVGYLAVIQQLDSLKAAKPDVDSLLRAVKAVSALGGLKRDQEMLLAFMGAAERPGGFLYEGRQQVQKGKLRPLRLVENDD
jgi:hypothetical protein